MTPANSTEPLISRPRDLVIMTSLISSASASHELSKEQIIGPCRKKPLVEARAAIVRKAVKFGMSYNEIGRHLGNRHHTTIMNLHNRGVK